LIMRTFEIAIAVLVVLRLAAALFGLRLPQWAKWIWGLALSVTLALQLILEGYRWQMLPLYVLAVGVFLLTLLPSKREPRRTVQIAGALLGLLLCILAVCLPVLLPVPRIPKPGGAYAVGTRTLELIDASRNELYSGNLDEPRRILVQVWYPAAPMPGGEYAPWLEHIDVYAPAIAAELKLPAFFLDHLKYAKTHSVAGAPIVAEAQPFPVLLFSHGWTGFHAQNTHQAEELASHGYVVAALEHSYGSIVTVFNDGRIARNNPQALPVGAPPEVLKAAGNRLVQQWAGDLGFVLDELTLLNQVGEWRGKLDLEHVGVFGHSTGGGATIEFCARDSRCIAGLALDAYLAPVSDELITHGPQQPFLFLYSEAWPSDANDQRFNSLRVGMGDHVYAYTLKGTDHYDFTDLPMLTPLATWLGLKGPLPASRVLPIIDAFELAFFDQYLKGEAGALLDEAPPFIETMVR
jgi:predicted dienelactone hydrolase